MIGRAVKFGLLLDLVAGDAAYDSFFLVFDTRCSKEMTRYRSTEGRALLDWVHTRELFHFLLFWVSCLRGHTIHHLFLVRESSFWWGEAGRQEGRKT